MEGNRHLLFDAAREMQSPRFRAIIRATSGRRRKPPDVKSFSHELNSKAPPHIPLPRLRGLSTPEAITKVVRSKFNRLKQEVNAELGVYAGDLVGMLEKTTDEHPERREPIEDLLVESQKVAEMSADEFWTKCEGIVQNLDDRRQELAMGVLKQAHTRLLFILTRCTRLLQFQKEAAYGEEEHLLGLHQFSDLGFYPEQAGGGKSAKDMKDRLIRKKIHERRMSASEGERNRISSWKKLPSAAEKNQKKIPEFNGEHRTKKMLDSLPLIDEITSLDISSEGTDAAKRAEGLASASLPSPGIQDQQDLTDEKPKMICRVCEFEIPTLHAEGHFRVCTVADRCDMKGLSVDERLERVAEILERLVEFCNPKTSYNGVNHRDAGVVFTEESNGQSPYRDKSPCPRPVHTREHSSEASGSPFTSLQKDLPSITCNSHYLTTLDRGTLTPGSMTPQSPMLTPRTSPMELLLAGKGSFSDLENFPQIQSLLDIVRCIARIKTNDYSSLEYLNSYLEDLSAVIDDRKVDGLVVETFGRRVEKLLQEKFIQLCGQIDDGDKDSLCVVDEDGSVDNGSAHSSRANSMGMKLKDRTSIEDFEIIKPISRGAFGRVFLAKKRVTGDLFAIKVLKKSDMIRKNAVESILAERNILITARNPFMVSFYYSFTCRDNLYLVMEYLNGGDLYSLLRNLGCLDEKMARTYIAELVLALEYLHSLNVIHRDLKPDNLLIARDGHLKLTDFGLSKVGLINSTDDLSGPDVSSVLFGDNEPMPAAQRAQKREQRRKQSAVGTPDYLAPEILLGISHGPTADWWSVGVILFELLVGIPPFNAEHPQKIFDNIMNRDIPWPQIPEELSYEAHDLIDKFLIQNPLQRLGATGSQEVKSHSFFKDISWDMLASEKAAFIPSTEDEEDTSYFACRHAWNSSDVRILHESSNEYDNLTDSSMSCGSSPHSCMDYEDGDEFGGLAEFGAPTLNVKYSFSNFSFKNLSLLACMNYDLITKCSNDATNATDASNT